VHGGLARSGKVRSQTPKVAPTEKSKKKTGRAKRRQQYTRRYVNVTVKPGGRKVGPNQMQHIIREAAAIAAAQASSK
jgi:small subunit ribosomal protein S30e